MSFVFSKKNLNASSVYCRSFERPSVRGKEMACQGEKMSKRILGGIIDRLQTNTSSWHLIGFPMMAVTLGQQYNIADDLFCFNVVSLCMAINVSVRYNGEFLPDVILLTLCYYHRGTLLNVMKRFCLCNLCSRSNVLTIFPCLGSAQKV